MGSKTKRGFIFIFVLLISLNPVFADIFISEIYHDWPGGDNGHEWVEVYNPGGYIALGEWYFEDASNDFWEGQCWRLSGYVNAEEYAVITRNSAQFLEDHPGFGGNIIDTTYTLHLDDEEGIIRLNHIPGGIYVGSSGHGDCVGPAEDEVHYETFGEGYSIERCADGLIRGPFNGNPGYTDCEYVIPEFSGIGLILASLAGLLLILKR
ncbi:MAG: lamin tail domain-containing protein [Candidatus Woesearchaeota archaeon]